MLEKIQDLIVDVARKEDSLLRRVGKGVTQIPEMAFTYALGREIALNAEEIFGNYQVVWRPETFIAQGSGRTDLVFDVEGQKGLAIEVKISGTADSYQTDIDKLKKIPDTYEKIFCALVDAWPQSLTNDGRIKVVESNSGVKRLCRDQFFDFFATLHEKYTRQLCCIVGVWHIV